MKPQPHPRRVIDRKYVRYIKTHPCLVFTFNFSFEIDACSGPLDAHHVKPPGGGKVGSKVSDWRCVPLCRKHHEEAERGKVAFECKYDIDLEWEVEWFNNAYIKPKTPGERKVSPTVQHISVRCSCGLVHRVPVSKAAAVFIDGTFAGFNFYCQSIKGQVWAKMRRSA